MDNLLLAKKCYLSKEKTIILDVGKGTPLKGLYLML